MLVPVLICGDILACTSIRHLVIERGEVESYLKVLMHTHTYVCDFRGSEDCYVC